MKNIIERIAGGGAKIARYLPKAVSTRLAVAALAVIAAGGAGASVTADAVWEGGFADGSTKTGASGITYTLKLHGNTSDATGATLPITAATGAQIVLSASSPNLAVLVKYSALNAAPTKTYELAAIRVKDKGWPGLRVASANGYDITGFYEHANTQTYGFSSTPKLSSTGGYFLLYHQGGSQTGGYAGSTLQQLSGGTTTSLKWGTDGTTLDIIVLGGPSATGLATSAYSGLVIEKVAIFNQVVTGADLATYAFPSEDPATTYDYTATISANTTFSDITWTTGTGTPGTDAKVYIEAQNNAVLTIGGTFDVGALWVNGGSIAFDTGTTVSSTKIVGAPINIATETVNFSDSFLASAINTTGACTINFTDCEIYGGITAAQNGDATINTYGNVVFGDIADNYFKYRTTFCVKSGSTTTYNSKNDRKLWCTVRVEKNATLINERQDSFDYNSNASYPIHAYIYGTLTLNQKWTVGKCARYIHLYDGALINGSAGNALHSNISGYACDFIAEEGTSTITAPFVKGNGTINVVTKENAMLVLSSSTELVKSGAGTLQLKDVAWTGAVSGSEGTVEVCNTRNTAHSQVSASGITFSGKIKFTAKGTYGVYVTNKDFLSTAVIPQLELDTGTSTYNKLFFKTTFDGVTTTIRDLMGSGGFTARDSYSVAQNQTFINRQTQDTEFSGVFLSEDGADDIHKTNLIVEGDGSGNVNTLKLSGANTSNGELKVRDDARVLFSSTGSWTNGTVTVADGGYLESQNSESIAATLAVQEGATLKFANGVPLAATAYDWSDVSNVQSVNVDLSGIAPSATPVTLIASGVTIDEAKFKVSASQRTATLSVENGALKATFANFWTDGSWRAAPVQNDSATLVLSQNSTLSVSEALTLGDITVENTSGGEVTLTVSGAGALTTGGWTIPAGVTVVTADGMEIAGDVTGGGIINVPANTTLTMDGVTTSGDTLADRVKVAVFGTLKTKGLTTLSAANTSAAGSLIEVVNGVTTLSSLTCGLSGNITIQSDGELKFAASYNASGADQGWDYLGTSSSNTVKVYGTLNMSDHNLWLRANNTLELYQGAEVLGSGTYASYYGSLIWAGNASLKAYGDAEINASITTLTDCSPVFNVAENKTLTISTAFIGQAVEITVNPTRISGGSLTKAGAGTLCLKNVAMTKPISGSEGTLQLLSDASGVKTHTATSSFSGKVIITRNANGGHHEIGTSSDDDSNPGVFFLSGSPELEINGSAAYLCLNRSFAGKYMMVKNLSATSGTIDAKYISGGMSKTIKCLQTDDTTYAGNFNGGGTTARYVDLLVYGQNKTVKTLTLSGASGTMNSYGTLTVKDYGKVKFSGSGDWAAGTVVVGANGYLEPGSDATTLASTLTLQDGATMAFVPNKMVTVTTLNLPSGEGETVTFDINYAPALDGTTLISSASIKANTDVGMIECENAIIKAEEGAIKAYPVATVTTYGSDAVVAYSSVQEAINNASAQNFQYVTAYQSETVTATGSILLKIDGGAVVTLNSSKAGYAYDVGTFVRDDIYVFSDSVQVAATFKWKTAVASGSWMATENWTSDDGNVSRMPGSLDTVIFESAALVETPVGGFSFAALQANASVTIKRDKLAIDDRLTRTVSAYGAISGTGSLTLNDGVNLANASDASLSIGVPVTVAGATALTVAEGVAASFTGSGTLTLDALTSTSIVGDGWTGTVVLPALTANEEYNFNSYGVSGSTVRLAGGFSTGWLANAAVNPAIEIPSGQTFTLGAFSPSYANAFAALKGDGTFAITAVANQANDLANVSNWGSGYDHYSAYFRIGDVSGFHGSITTTSDVGVALGSTKPAKNTTGGKILVYGNVTVGETATWTAPNGVILADANATLVVPSGATVPVPTTTVPRHVVKATTVDGTTTYSVVAKGFFFMTY